jgi:hypothetical protein
VFRLVKEFIPSGSGPPDKEASRKPGRIFSVARPSQFPAKAVIYSQCRHPDVTCRGLNPYFGRLKSELGSGSRRADHEGRTFELGESQRNVVEPFSRSPTGCGDSSPVKPAALGFRMHSGWGMLVAVSAHPNLVEVMVRKRIVTADPSIAGANQPYHYAANLKLLEAAERYLAKCATVSESLAFAAIGEVVRELEERDYRVVGSALLLAAGRPLPSLANILAAHSLIHTAEGEFFRNAVQKACERSKISVARIRERELDGVVKTTFGDRASRLEHRIASLGHSIGPPWTKDHKLATLAAAVIVGGEGAVGGDRI